MKYLQKKESFSFSTSSRNDLFSDDEDVDATGGRISGHHQNDYFEISLPTPPPPQPPSSTTTNHRREEEFEFCFSFNSSSTLLDFPTSPISADSNRPFHHREPPLTVSTLAASQELVSVNKKYKGNCIYPSGDKNNKSMNYKRMYRKTSSPKCRQGLISPYTFPASRIPSFDETQRELIKNRSSPRLSGIRKFLIKLRSIKSMLRSSIKASRRLQSPTTIKGNKKNKKTSIDHKQKDRSHMTNKSNNNNSLTGATHSQKQNQEEEKHLGRLNFNGFSKMFDIITKNIMVTRRSKQTGSKSCPVSIKSSPMHDLNVRNSCDERRSSFYSRDHSIQAAIAHCKKSFGK